MTPVNKLLCGLLLVFMVGCNPQTTTRPDANSIVKLKLQPLPPLDLKPYYFELKYLNQDNVCMSMDGVRRISELNTILRNRIELQNKYIQTYQKYYESDSK